MKFMKTIFSKKISLIYVLIFTIGTAGATYFFQHTKESNNAAYISSNQVITSCVNNVVRLDGYKLIKPLMFIDNASESESLNQLKGEVNNIILSFKSQGIISTASVYLKNFNKNEWMNINGFEKFSTGSLLKVPTLMAFLKMSETEPQLLNKKLSFNHEFKTSKDPKILEKSIQLGRSYSIKELLTYMIKYSDNNATSLLNSILDQKIFDKIFADLGIEKPDWTKRTYLINSYDYSKFFRILYNGSYLGLSQSEFALELLSETEYNNGIIKGIPKNITVAHKFGESGNQFEKELHESGIIFLNNSPYIITIMTRGKDLEKLPEVINQISALTFQALSNQSI